MPNAISVPDWFEGAWKREWIRRRGGRPDETTAVRFVQTPTLFGDVRVPKARPTFTGAESLSDLTDDQLVILCAQQGFAGFTTLEGDHATWHHEIDYEPFDGGQDIGRIERGAGSDMYEHALDDSYTEHWWRLSSGDARFLGVRTLQRSGDIDRIHQILCVAGDYFVYARNRPKDLPQGDSLASLIQQLQPARAALIEFLDCEISHGLVRGGRQPWEIQASTLPWREGKALELIDELQVDPTTGQLQHRGPIPHGQLWSFPETSFTVEDLRVLLPSDRPVDR